MKTILIDDDEVFLMMTKKMMANSDFDQAPVSFTSGEEALKFMEEDYSVNEVYLLFLDINMPGMNGWEFLEKVAPMITEQNTYVFLTTSSTDDEDIAQAGEHDLVYQFLSKPVLTETFSQLKEHEALEPLFRK